MYRVSETTAENNIKKRCRVDEIDHECNAFVLELLIYKALRWLNNNTAADTIVSTAVSFLVRVFITDSMNKLLTAVKHTLFKDIINN